MEYSSDHQVYCSPKNKEPDLLTQSLTSVFGNSAAVVPPQDDREQEVYAVPIQQYPDLGINTTTAPQGPSDKVRSDDGSAVQVVVCEQPGRQECSGDLISAAWSLSCDMTKSWQKAEEAATKDEPSKQTEEVVLTSVNNVADTVPVQDSIRVNEASSGVRVTGPQKVQPIETTPNIQIPETHTAVTHAPRSNCGKELATIHQENGDKAVPGSCVSEVIESEKVTHKENEVETENQTLSPFTAALEQPPKKVSDSSDKIIEAEEKIPENLSPKSGSSPEVITPDSKRQRKSSAHSTPTTKAVILEKGSNERPQRKRKLPYKLIDESIIKDSKETAVIINEHKKCKSSPKPTTTTTPTEPDPDSESERLKQQKLLDFQRRYSMSQRTRNVEPSDPDSISSTRTFSLMDIGISLNAKGEVTLAMPDSIKKLAKAGGTVNINFDVDCLDDDNCLKFKVTEDKDAITTAIGNEVGKNPDVPMLIESESSDERSQSPKLESKMIVPIITEEDDPPPTTTNQKTLSRTSRDSSIQVNLNIQSEDDYLDEKLLRASTANGFVSYPRFTHVTGSSLATVHKVMKSVKKGLSIDKLTRKPTWFCSLCNLTGDYGDMGPLFGPFDIYVPPKNSYRNKSMSDGATNLFEKLSSTFNKDININDDSEITVQREEVWLHEDCICWSPGVYMIGLNIYGLEEIFKVARFTLCSDCGEIGASLGCFKEGCRNRYHYRCSIKAKCKLIKTTFTVLCPTHSHGIVDNCLSAKPFVQVRNFLSQEEIDESEILLGRRPGDDARETAVKITKTRIIRSRKSKAKKKKTVHEVRKRSVPVKEVEDEEVEEPNVKGADGDTTIEETSDEYKCFGCGISFMGIQSIRRHFTNINYTDCRKQHVKRLVDYDEDLPASMRVCYSCGHYVRAGRMKAHLVNTPNQRCMTEHMRVVKDVKGLDVEAYFIEDKAFHHSTLEYRDIDGNCYTYKCYGCLRTRNSIRQHRRHMCSNHECRDRHIEHVIADSSGVPNGILVCFSCGCYVREGHIRSHYAKRKTCKQIHERINLLKGEKKAGEREADDQNEEEMEEEEDEREDDQPLALIASYQYKCYGCQTFFANPSNHKRHLSRTRKCRDQHVNRVRVDDSGIPDEVEVCLSCGLYVMKGGLMHHFAKTKVLRKDCEEIHKKIINERKDEEEAFLGGKDQVTTEEAPADKPKEITVDKDKETKSKVKVEKLDAAEESTLQSGASTTKPKQEDILHCSKCETRTKDRAYLKKHFRAQHCPVGCGDYDLICTDCVRALKLIVTFPRGLEGFDYRTISKDGLKCPECPAKSHKNNTHYIRSHYREQHCKIGCSSYDQICTGCVAVLEKLITWPKPLVGHDYSTGPPPVGFQCPKCRKGIDRQYFKRHYRHLHCKSHCIEHDKVCKKCFVVFKKMNLIPR